MDHPTNPRDLDQARPGESETIVVGIGASAGGIEALSEFFSQVQPDSGMAYVVILHLSPDQDSQLAQILQRASPIPVTQVTGQVKVLPNQVYVVPPNRHLQMEGSSILVVPTVSIDERRAPVDIFFRTLAETHGPRAIAVILSGTGANGSMGLKRVKEKGGAVFVQSPREAAYNEMPRHAIGTDLVDEVLPVAQLPARLQLYRQSLGTISIPVEAQERPEDQQQALREVFTQLRLRTGHDFSNYKRATLLRRLARRIHVRDLPDLPAYVAYLHEYPDEVQALLKDLLISVTNFFRDAAVFTTIENQVIPALIAGKKADETIRVWVAGCATGEEAYSLAMLLTEQTIGILEAPDIQVFATDIDEDAIATAREGLYTLNDAADVSPERLLRFFTKEGEEYRVRREVREKVLFAHHNVLKDPPFSRLDLVTCRNLLIYFNQTAQERVLETVHFALKPGSYLVLGQSETVDGSSDLYTTLSREHHIYQSRQVAARPYPLPEGIPALPTSRRRPTDPATETDARPALRLSYGDLHQQLLEQYAPPSIIVNEDYDMLHLSERAGRYLQVAGGEPTKNLLKLIRPELRLELRTAFIQAIQHQTNVDVRNLTIRIDDQPELITIHVRPILRENDPARGFILVLFEPVDGETVGANQRSTSVEPVARHLEEELIRVKAQLRASNEHHELQSEEMKASNEELQAMNEELRSAAEELETGKEELQSVNEELITVNQELKVKVEEISITSNNLQNLINSTDIATLFLDRSLRVNLFTPPIRQLFNLIPSDVGRPLTDITNRIEDQDILAYAQQVLITLQTVEREVRTTDGQTFIMRVLPYRTNDDRIKGIVVTFVDITERKRASKALTMSEEQFRLFVTASSDTIYKMSADWQQMIQLNGGSFLADTHDPTRSWLEQYIPPADQPAVERVIRQAVQNQQMFEMEHRVVRVDGRIGWTFSRAIPVLDEQGQIREWFGAASDITLRKEADETLQESEKQKAFLLALSDALRPLTDSVAIQTTTMQVLGTHLNVMRATYFEVDPDQDTFRLTARYERDALPIPNQMRLSDFSADLATDYRRGRTLTVTDTENEAQAEAYRAIGVRAWAAVPLVKNGQLLAIMGVHAKTPRTWTRAEMQLLDETAERTWSVVEQARAEDALRESEQHLASIRPLTLLGQTEELAHIGSWEYDRQTGQFTWSKGMYTLFEIELGQPVQLEIYLNFVTAEDQPNAQRLVTYFHEGMGPLELDLRIRVAEQTKTLRIKADVIGQGDQERVLGVDLDISDQLAAQQQIQETATNLQAVLDGSPAAIGLLKTIRDPVDAGRIIDFTLVVGNRKLAEFFKAPLIQLLGQSATTFSDLLWDGQTLDILRQVRLTGEAHYDEQHLPTDGRWLGIAVTCQDDDVLITALDVTEMKTIQDQQQHWLGEMEASRQSVEALGELRDSLSHRSELLRAVSHDLRGNFGIITGALQLLTMADSEADRAQMMDMVLRNVRQATTMLTELLDFSRLETGQQQHSLEPFDLATLLAELAQSLQPAAREQSLVLAGEGPTALVVESDQVLVYRLAQNLTINAIKYTHQGSVRVNWDSNEQHWWLSVSDTGPGLDSQLVSALNGESPIETAPQSGQMGALGVTTSWTNLRGEGIGLRIVRQITQLLGARLEVSSEIGVGTTFTVWFPLRYE